MTDVFYSLEQAAQTIEDSVVAIGNFDGVHIGHQAIFEQARVVADRRGVCVVGLTFDPHPRAYFRPDQAPTRLTLPEQKYELMHHYGVDAVVALTFNDDLAGQTPTEFVESILVDGLGAVEVVVGADFRFGRKRAGDVEVLAELGGIFGYVCGVAEFVQWEGETVSSTRIRGAVERGELDAAREMLGRPFRLVGEVVHGDARGRTLGFPTANMEVPKMAMPASGVYATKLAEAGQQPWTGITNIGHRPTFEGDELSVETFVLDDVDKLDLYGKEVELDLYRRIRGEEKFDSPQDLVAQIERDIEKVRNFFEPGVS